MQSRGMTVLATVLMLSMWFCTSAGFVNALITTVIVVAVGIFALRSRAKPAH